MDAPRQDTAPAEAQDVIDFVTMGMFIIGAQSLIRHPYSLPLPAVLRQTKWLEVIRLSSFTFILIDVAHTFSLVDVAYTFNLVDVTLCLLSDRWTLLPYTFNLADVPYSPILSFWSCSRIPLSWPCIKSTFILST